MWVLSRLRRRCEGREVGIEMPSSPWHGYEISLRDDALDAMEVSPSLELLLVGHHMCSSESAATGHSRVTLKR